jgi:uncharacterized protein (DUF58 family)
LPLWPSARALWALAGIAVVLACSPGAPVCLPLAVVLGGLLVVAFVVDVVLLPRAQALRVRRALPSHFSLRRSAELRYTIENRSPRALRVGLVEAPLRTLDLGESDVVALYRPAVKSRPHLRRCRSRAAATLLPASTSGMKVRSGCCAVVR